MASAQVYPYIMTCSWSKQIKTSITYCILQLCSWHAKSRATTNNFMFARTNCLEQGVRSAINWCPNIQTAPRARLLVSHDMSDHWLTHAFFLAVSLFHSGADRSQRMTATTKRRQARGCGIRRQQTANNACNTKGAKTRGKHGMKRKESDS